MIISLQIPLKYRMNKKLPPKLKALECHYPVIQFYMRKDLCKSIQVMYFNKKNVILSIDVSLI